MVVSLEQREQLVEIMNLVPKLAQLTGQKDPHFLLLRRYSYLPLHFNQLRRFSVVAATVTIAGLLTVSSLSGPVVGSTARLRETSYTR
jgi:hypothetical protein